MTLIKFDPLREMLQLHRRLANPGLDSDDAYGSWAPAVDIFERGDDLVIRAEVPGVEKDAIDVSVENNTLVLSGERSRGAEITDENSYRLERTYGRFVRTFRLPKNVNAGNIGATYRNGVLELVLPKAEEAKPRKIQIDAA